VSPNDSGMWRRIVQIPFTAIIPPSEQDPELKKRLTGDPSVQTAILAWAVEGCRLWQEEGLTPPARVIAYTEEYRVESDPLADFFDEMCSVEVAAITQRSRVRAVYHQWAKRNQLEPVSDKELSAGLRARGVEDAEKKHKGERAWRGVALGGSRPVINDDTAE